MTRERQLTLGGEDTHVVAAVRTPVTNVVSDNPISCASTCMVVAVQARGRSGTTQSWLPANGTGVNTSTSRNGTPTARQYRSVIATLGAAPRV